MDYDSDASSDDGDFTALHSAACKNKPRIVRKLLKKGADTKARTWYNEWAPIHSGVHKHSYSAVQELLKFDRRQVRLISKTGWTPLHIAVWSGDRGIAKLLVDNGADVDSETSQGFTALHLAAIQNDAHLAKFLLRNKADTDKRTCGKDWAPIHSAANGGCTAVIQELVHFDRDQKELATCYGFRPLHIAARQGHTDAVLALLESEADPNATTSEGFTALHFTALMGRTEVAKTLLLAGADMEVATSGLGWTPLHVAASKGNMSVVRTLLQFGAKATALSDRNETPLDCAARNGHLAICQVLKEIQDILDETSGSHLQKTEDV